MLGRRHTRARLPGRQACGGPPRVPPDLVAPTRLSPSSALDVCRYPNIHFTMLGMGEGPTRGPAGGGWAMDSRRRTSMSSRGPRRRQGLLAASPHGDRQAALPAAPVRPPIVALPIGLPTAGALGAAGGREASLVGGFQNSRPPASPCPRPPDTGCC